eukprot:TRINITY_DN11021_c0_g1_i1.p1 TRINITY_DN11021_c0_g1~~TRINITY_DN11021_c0_g1_i1.p1  ORF type:complete len:328 (+),score=47.11 TRINITY_DN11021_c0_g1_i1:142-1125(+)
MMSTFEVPETIVSVNNLNFGYEPGENHRVIHDVSFELPRGSRCVVVGANGSGKSTLLRLLSGRHVVQEPESCIIVGKRAFIDRPPGVSYVSTEVSPHYRGDVLVERLVDRGGGKKDFDRTNKLLKVLEVDLQWHMHRLSDGQRRRVLLLLALIHPRNLLLLDEATMDLDVLVRRDLLDFLEEECRVNRCTVVYCTHIYDGMGHWPTHILHMSDGRISHFAPINENFKAGCIAQPANYSLYKEIKELLSSEKSERMTDTESDDEERISSLGRMDSVLFLLIAKWLKYDREQLRSNMIRQKEAQAAMPSEAVEKLAKESDRYYDYWERK